MPKRAPRGGAHLRDLAPGLHGSEETWQRCRAVCGTVPIYPAWESNPGLPALIALCFTTELPAGLRS